MSSADKRQTCLSLRRVSTATLLGFAILSPASAQWHLRSQQNSQRPPRLQNVDVSSDHVFTLRHVFHHGLYRYPSMHRRHDVQVQGSPEDKKNGLEISNQITLPARSKISPIQRMSNRRPDHVEALILEQRLSDSPSLLTQAITWSIDDIPHPNITDRDTVLSLARMTQNAYVKEPNDTDWREVGGDWNVTVDIGWESDGLRGHVYASETNSTIVIGLKGTNHGYFDGGDGVTVPNDKLNDNLLFSCCCARVNWRWATVCDCYSGTYSCDNKCLRRELRNENRYYRAVLDIYYNISSIYPEANVWVTGHSLGGAVASLLGQTYGLPTVTFEAPPEKLASDRLKLPIPPGVPSRVSNLTGIFHFGNTADPIFMGACNGLSSICYAGGYAFESQCHTGAECVYDTVNDKGWRMGIQHHPISTVIDNIILSYNSTPECKFDEECVDCFNWNFFEGNRSRSTTSASSHSTTIKSSTTCTHMGWWGCLDDKYPETSTTTITTTEPVTTTVEPTSTSTASTPKSSSTTCTHMGWFGCLDPSPTSSGTSKSKFHTSTKTSKSHTTTCSSEGWFGCLDPITTTITTTTTGGITITTTSTCTHPGFFGCNDELYESSTITTTTTTSPHPITTTLPLPSTSVPVTTTVPISKSSPPPLPSKPPGKPKKGKKEKKCVEWTLYPFWCKEWKTIENDSGTSYPHAGDL